VRSFRERLLGAARVDADVFAEVARDAGATRQALVVALLSGAAAGAPALADLDAAAALTSAARALVGWGLVAVVLASIGGRFFAERRGDATFAELLRALGFASAAGMVRVLGMVATLRPAALVLADLWIVAGMAVALRRVLARCAPPPSARSPGWHRRRQPSRSSPASRCDCTRPTSTRHRRGRTHRRPPPSESCTRAPSHRRSSADLVDLYKWP
jgi:hypothetical protein